MHHIIEEEQKTLLYQKRFYADANNFNYFENIDANIIKRIQIVLQTLFKESEYPKGSPKRYFFIIDYLNSKNNKDFTTFDEKFSS